MRKVLIVLTLEMLKVFKLDGFVLCMFVGFCSGYC